MTKFLVYLNAPSRAQLEHESGEPFQWQTAAYSPLLLEPATLEAASQRVSLYYRNVIFDDSESMDEVAGQITALSPPVSQELEQEGVSCELSLPSETQDKTCKTDSFDTSSVIHFPTFRIDLHTLASLSNLLNSGAERKAQGSKVNVLLAALEVEGPEMITIKKGSDAGKQVARLTMILGDEDGCLCKLTAWREVAELWGGTRGAPGARRGDVLLIQNVSHGFADASSKTTLTLTASPALLSQLTICYRTFPSNREDRRFIPDLRVGINDAGVRKVASIVRWFEKMAGLAR